MNALLARKRVELERKLGAVTTSVEAWRTVSATGKAHQRHHSQVKRIAEVIAEYQRLLTQRLPAADDEARLLAESEGLARATVDLHRIWEFFRAKLAQRDVATLWTHLRAADELAWRCWEPARAVAPGGASLKQPPLVYLNGGWSPLALSRERAFTAEYVEGQLRLDSSLRKAVERVPVPVIGLPWTQLAHAPEMIAVGHEVGHIVEQELKLEGAVSTLLTAATKDATEPAAWARWRSEIFADVFACAALGRAALSTLIDFLIKPAATVNVQDVATFAKGDYPPDSLRVAICAGALTALKIDHDDIMKDWQKLYAAPAKVDDTAARAAGAALLRGPYPGLGNKSLADLFPAGDVERLAGLLTQGIATGTDDARLLMMALRRAYDTAPGKIDPERAHKLVLHPLAKIDGDRGATVASAPDTERTLAATLLDEILGGTR